MAGLMRHPLHSLLLLACISGFSACHALPRAPWTLDAQHLDRGNTGSRQHIIDSHLRFSLQSQLSDDLDDVGWGCGWNTHKPCSMGNYGSCVRTLHDSSSSMCHVIRLWLYRTSQEERRCLMVLWADQQGQSHRRSPAASRGGWLPPRAQPLSASHPSTSFQLLSRRPPPASLPRPCRLPY